MTDSLRIDFAALNYERIQSLDPEMLEYVYIVSPDHSLPDNGDVLIKRHAPFFDVYLSMFAGEDEEKEKEIITDFSNLGIIKQTKETRCPIHFYHVSTLLVGDKRDIPLTATFVCLDPSELVPISETVLSGSYGISRGMAALMANVLEDGYLLKNRTRKLEPFHLLFDNEKVYPTFTNGSFSILSGDLNFWKRVTKSWYERTSGKYWGKLSVEAQKRHIVNRIRHSSSYELACGTELSKDQYITIFEIVNKGIATVFPSLRSIALKQIDAKEFDINQISRNF